MQVHEHTANAVKQSVIIENGLQASQQYRGKVKQKTIAVYPIHLDWAEVDCHKG